MEVIGNIFLTALVALIVWQYVFRFGKDTIGSDRVPMYYQNHGVREIVMAGTLGLLILAGTWREGSPAALGMVAVSGLGLVGSFWLGVATVGFGRQFEEDASDDVAPFINHVAQVVLFTVGMVLKWTVVMNR